MKKTLLIAMLGLVGLPAWAASASAAAAPMSSSLAGLAQVVLGLVIVLAAVLACTWLFRRFSSGMVGVPRHLRVVSAVMVGQRERVVIVELKGEWLVLGVTPHAVNLLSKQPTPAETATEARGPAALQQPFARWLKAALSQQRSTKDHKK